MPVRQSSIWSTDNVSQNERFDYWRESIRTCFNPMSPQIEKSEIGSFRGQLEATQLGAAIFLNINATAHNTGRTPRDIENGRGEYIALYRERGKTIFEFDFSRGRYHMSLPAKHGDLVIGNTNRPYNVLCKPHVALNKSVLFLPKELFCGMELNLDNALIKVIPRDMGVGSLLSDYFDSLTGNALHLEEAQNTALQVLATLTASAYGRLSSSVDVKAARLAAQLAAIKNLIDKSLSMPHLDSAAIADKAGISIRNLHRLFEGSGITVSQYIRDRRLELAKTLLRSPDRRYQNVSTIAFDCGFESLATFYRVFRHRSLCTPLDYRAIHRESVAIADGGERQRG